MVLFQFLYIYCRMLHSSLNHGQKHEIVSTYNQPKTVKKGFCTKQPLSQSSIYFPGVFHQPTVNRWTLPGDSWAVIGGGRGAQGNVATGMEQTVWTFPPGKDHIYRIPYTKRESIIYDCIYCIHEVRYVREARSNICYLTSTSRKSHHQLKGAD